MKTFSEVTVIVDGALDAVETFTDDAALTAFIMQVSAESAADGLPTEVYILHHPHAPSADECACAQYLTDHHPDYTFNTETE